MAIETVLAGTKMHSGVALCSDWEAIGVLKEVIALSNSELRGNRFRVFSEDSTCQAVLQLAHSILRRSPNHQVAIAHDGNNTSRLELTVDYAVFPWTRTMLRFFETSPDGKFSRIHYPTSNDPQGTHFMDVYSIFKPFTVGHIGTNGKDGSGDLGLLVGAERSMLASLINWN